MCFCYLLVYLVTSGSAIKEGDSCKTKIELAQEIITELVESGVNIEYREHVTFAMSINTQED
jgi:hypothetical protein